MQLLSSTLAQLRTSWPTILLILLISALPLSFVVLLNASHDIPFGELTRDPTATIGAPIYTGFLSQVGILLWAAAVAVCMLSARVSSSTFKNPTITRFFFTSGLITLMLGLDDAFLLHEEFFPHIGFSEEVVYASYAGLIIVYLAVFRLFILKTEYILLGMGFVFFGLSVGLDAITPQDVDLFLLEDGAKLVGIVSWLIYFYRLAASTIHQSITQRHMVLGAD